MHPLPEGLAAIDGLQGLKYTGIVVDEVTM